jgi:hypothetical protein
MYVFFLIILIKMIASGTLLNVVSTFTSLFRNSTYFSYTNNKFNILRRSRTFLVINNLINHLYKILSILTYL